MHPTRTSALLLAVQVFTMLRARPHRRSPGDPEQQRERGGRRRVASRQWQVGSSATLGTTSVFVGIILADQSVSLATGATLNGRALVRIAAVTLDTNDVTIPAL